MATTLALALFAFYYFDLCAARPLVRQTVALEKLAREIQRLGGDDFPLAHVDDPMTLQIFLNTLRPRITFEEAAGLLRGPGRVFVAVDDVPRLEAARSPGDPPVYFLLPESGRACSGPTHILSNRPDLQSGPVPGPLLGNARLSRPIDLRF